MLQGTVGNCVETFKARYRQDWKFIGITFVLSVNKKHAKMCKEWAHSWNINLNCPTFQDKWMTSLL